MQDQAINQLTRVLKSMAHPIRLQILCLLLEGEMSVMEIHEHFPTSYANVAQHLHKLQQQGLVGSDKRANFIFNYIADPRISDTIRLVRRLYCQDTQQ